MALEKRQIDEKIEALAALREQSLLGGGQQRVDQQHQRGKLTARERLAKLMDEGTFQEIDSFVTHRATEFGLGNRTFLGDAVVTGYGSVDGRKVFAYAQDFTVFGGSLSEVVGEKICKVMDLAGKSGWPVVGLNDSGGARIQEGADSLAAYGDIFLRNTRYSGVIPQVSVIMGPSAGGAVYSPAITDFIFMVKGIGQMYITGPDVVKAVTGADVTHEELGGADSHASRSGVAHFVYPTEEECLSEVRRLLSFLPSNNVGDPPVYATSDPAGREDPELRYIVPDEANRPYDVREIVYRLVDDEEFMEVQPDYAPNVVVGFARFAGRPVGIVGEPTGVPGGGAGYQRIGEGGPVRPFLRLLQHPAGDAGGCSRVHAGGGPGVRGDYPARGEADIRLRGSNGAQDKRHHPQGIRRGVYRDEQQASERGHQPGVAVGGDSGDGAGRRGEHHPPGADFPVGEPGADQAGTGEGLPGEVHESLRGGEPGLPGRRDRPGPDQGEDSVGAGCSPGETGQSSATETREHPAVKGLRGKGYVMEFGLFDQLPCAPTQDVGARYNDIIAQGQLADRLGLDAVWLAEYHFNPRFSVLPAPLLLASAIARCTERVKVATAVNLLPLHQPVRLAEEWATLDVLSGGRAVFGIGRGSNPEHYSGMGIATEEGRPRFLEALDVVIKCWTEERLHHHGEFFQADDVAVVPKPVQKPHPPVYIASNSEDTFRWLGRWGTTSWLRR